MDRALTKSELRQSLRAARIQHEAAQPDSIRALLFNRPPAPLLARIPEHAVIGLYRATAGEAPAAGYARFFHEAGHTIALPHFAAPDAPMGFREHTDPYGECDLSRGAFAMMQPSSEASPLVPDVLFVPVVGFNEHLDRLGQGGGHYDRWLSEHPGRIAIGLAWDVQLVEELPTESHDIQLDAVVTPTRLYGLNGKTHTDA